MESGSKGRRSKGKLPDRSLRERESKRRRGKGKALDESLREHEFKHASATLPVDYEAWRTALAHREQMPHVDMSMLDPGPRIAALLDGRSEGVLFMGEAAEHVTARLTDAPEAILQSPVLATVDVVTDVDFTVGTLVIGMSGLDHRVGITETARLFDLGENLATDVRLVKFSAVGPLSQYLWARICGRGLYSAIALPFSVASLVALLTLKTLAVPLASAGQRTRLATARAVTRPLAKSMQAGRGRRRRVDHADMLEAIRLAGIPQPFFDTDEDRADEDLDLLAGRFAANPFLPEIQILMDLDRERSAAWSG